MTYQAPLREFRFVLDDVLAIGRYANLPGFSDATPDVVGAILEEGAKISEEVLAPLNESGDREGCTYNPSDHSVTTPQGFREAYRTYAEGGWIGLSADPEFGGQGLPAVLSLAFNEMVVAANWSFAMYPGLSHGAYSALHIHGTEEQKATYLPKLVSGEWSGTMNLTEPHCGTDLGLMRTRAEPQEDGSYKLTGTKIWISSGEHDFTSNVIHLVLAKIPGGPEGIKGVSLFVVPKYLVNPDGSSGERNAVYCGGLEEKMGIHANATCVINYEGATGWLVGEEHKGMRAMFTMMNAARLGVGLQGLAISEVAYQNALAFARERLQGRALTGPARPDKPADPIIVHPDVRRMLMDIKTFNEGARTLVLWTGLWGDLLLKSDDPSVRQKADDYMALMTPVIKAYCTDQGFYNAVTAQQVLGGAGFVKDYPLEQFVRDSRIGMIYEGTNGIQALDLVGRKLMQNNGRAVTAFFADVDNFIAENRGDKDLKPALDVLADTTGKAREATEWLAKYALTDFNHAGAAATDYLYLMAYASLSWMWALTEKTARDRLADGGDPAFYKAKLKTSRYFRERVLPAAGMHLARLTSGAEPVMALAEDEF
ncbi:MAG: acyl-CoA dehydrogenase C-terminal domain-containing protein [Alphaproteobacteria bacterium]